MRGEGGDRETERRQGDCTEKQEQGEGDTETGQTESEKHKARQKERGQDGVTEEPAGRDPDSDRKGASPLQTLAGDGDEAEGHTCCPNASQPWCPLSPGLGKTRWSWVGGQVGGRCCHKQMYRQTDRAPRV